MDVIENDPSTTGTGQWGSDLPITPEEGFVRAVYSSLDRAIECGLDRLRREDRIVPSCTIGCSHCCRYLILMSAAEARTLAQYVRRELSPQQREDLRIRTRQWHEWDDSLRGQTDLSRHIPRCPCPLLVGNACSAYPVRPVVCRTHFVLSHPLCCRAASDPEFTAPPPLAIGAIVTATRPFSAALRAYVENTGVDYSRTMSLLPHGLAIEMGWDDGIF